MQLPFISNQCGLNREDKDQTDHVMIGLVTLSGLAQNQFVILICPE